MQILRIKSGIMPDVTGEKIALVDADDLVQEPEKILRDDQRRV
ncbi:1378_t:CDS:2 [Gigaspora rosea]|nr:1378_t:CDS:2 [Gigaspora rosea]